MASPTFLTTDPVPGVIITTESGEEIITDVAASPSVPPLPTDTIQMFDFSVNLLKSIIWQYTNAKNVQGLLNAKAEWYLENQTQFWQDWYNDVFNLATANQFGLVVWGIILGLPLYVNQPAPGGPIFGFDGSGDVNFDNGILGDTGSSVVLPIETQRIALRLRYFQLIGTTCVPEINRMLAYVFKSYGQVYLLDNHDMTQTYIFNFPVAWDLKYLLNNYDILPRPAGVQSSWIDNTLEYFGFESYNFNFDNGILAG
jgi:hypothetical protein